MAASKILLQVFLNKGVLTADELHQAYLQICIKAGIDANQASVRNDVVQVIAEINDQISPVSMEIRRGRDEDSGGKVYALVRTSESNLGQLSTSFQQNELELYKKILDLIVDSEVGMVSSTDILNLSTRLEKKKLSKKEAEEVLARFIRNKWIVQDRGEISLSTRSILEMETYLKEVYGEDLFTCFMCKELVFKGQACQCNIKIHLHCAAHLFHNRDNANCPNCGNSWDHEVPQPVPDENEADNNTSETNGLPVASNPTRKRKAPRARSTRN